MSEPKNDCSVLTVATLNFIEDGQEKEEDKVKELDSIFFNFIDMNFLYSDLLDKLQNPLWMYSYIIVLLYHWSNIIDSVLALVNKGALQYWDGEKGIAIFMHSIAVIN